MTTLTDRPPLVTTTAAAAPGRRTLVALSVGFLALFGVGLATSKDPSEIASPATVVRQFDVSHTMLLTQVGAAVFAAVVLVFLGAALRAVLAAGGRSWTSAVVGYGFTLAAVAMLVLTLPTLWLWHAIDVGDTEAVHVLTIIDTGTFPALMLTYATTFVGVGIAARVTRQLPTWLCAVSVLIGVAAPVGPGGYVAFALFPVWLVVVAAMVRLDPSSVS